MRDRYDDESRETMVLSDLLRFADHNPDFNRDFVDDVYEFFESLGYITGNQLYALQKIYKDEDVKKFIDEMGRYERRIR